MDSAYCNLPSVPKLSEKKRNPAAEPIVYVPEATLYIQALCSDLSAIDVPIKKKLVPKKKNGKESTQKAGFVRQKIHQPAEEMK
jgi:hypothetical protein